MHVQGIRRLPVVDCGYPGIRPEIGVSWCTELSLHAPDASRVPSTLGISACLFSRTLDLYLNACLAAREADYPSVPSSRWSQ